MEKNAAREFKLRWQRVSELERAARPPAPETKLRQLEWLLEMSRKAGWPVNKSEAEVDEVRRHWNSLRSRLHGSSAG